MENAYLRILQEINKYGKLNVAISQRLEWRKILEKDLQDFIPIRGIKPNIKNVFAHDGDVFAVLEYDYKDSRRLPLFLVRKGHSLDNMVRKANNILHIYRWKNEKKGEAS